ELMRKAALVTPTNGPCPRTIAHSLTWRAATIELTGNKNRKYKSPWKQGLFEYWRTERDTNPRYAMNVYTLSRRAPSTTRPPVQKKRKLYLLSGQSSSQTQCLFAPSNHYYNRGT